MIELYRTDNLPGITEFPHRCMITLDGVDLRVVTFIRTPHPNPKNKHVSRIITINKLDITHKATEDSFEFVEVNDTPGHSLAAAYREWEAELLKEPAHV